MVAAMTIIIPITIHLAQKTARVDYKNLMVSSLQPICLAQVTTLRVDHATRESTILPSLPIHLA